MATIPAQLDDLQPTKPRAVSMPGAGEERTVDAPMPSKADEDQAEGLDEQQTQKSPDKLEKLTDKQKKGILDVIREYTTRWAPVKRRRARQALKAREYLKGNQYIAFDGERFIWYDPLEAIFEGTADKEDMAMYRYINNVYQMLGISFVAALSPQVPKTRFLPHNAERQEDMATATSASTLQEIIERQNNIKALQKEELALLWTDGCYFKYTRFVVDAARAGTHKEPYIAGFEEQQVLPDRFLCQQCGEVTPADQTSPFSFEPMCATCGAVMGPSDYFPGESMPLPVMGEKEVPNGMVTMGVYGVLNVTAAPYANDVKWTPMLRLDEEIDKASIRAAYPDAWKDVATQHAGGSPESEAERIARQTVYNAIGGRNNLTADMMPTLSKTWIQEWAFNILDDKQLADELRELFPSGCMAVSLGIDKLLEVREERLTEHWTWCGTIKGYGLYPFAVGDAAMDVQDRINDSANSIQEYIDRCASTPLFVDQDLFSTRRLNNKPNLPGTITEVNLKKSQNKSIRDAMYQPQVTIADRIFAYVPDLIDFAQLVSGVLPQTFGGSDPNVKTSSGQARMLNVALGRLGLFWDNIREEHAQSAELGVRSAANNYTEDIMDVVTGDTSEEYRNQYVYINDLRGEFHAYPETDQGYPQTYAEMRDRFIEFLNAANEKPGGIYEEMLNEPVNQKLFMMYAGAPGMVLPGDAERQKTLRTIQDLLKGQPSTETRPNPQDPMGQPVTIAMPSIVPDPDFDDFEIAIKVIKRWWNEHYDQAAENPQGFENLRAYYRVVHEMALQEAMRMQAQMAEEQAKAAPPQAAGAAK